MQNSKNRWRRDHQEGGLVEKGHAKLLPLIFLYGSLKIVEREHERLEKMTDMQSDNSGIRWIDGTFVTVFLSAMFYFGGRIYIEHYYNSLGLPVDLYGENFRILLGEGGIELIFLVLGELFVISLISIVFEFLKHKFPNKMHNIKEYFGNLKYFRLFLINIIIFLFMFTYWKFSSHIGDRAAQTQMIRLENNCEGALATVFTTTQGHELQRTGFLFTGFGKFVVLMTENEKILIPQKTIQQINLLRNNLHVCKSIADGFPKFDQPN
ncbi:MAG: hypothetical protein ACYCYP_12840 [Leptospirales bacterium]